MSKKEIDRAWITLGVSVNVSRELLEAIEKELGPDGVTGIVLMSPGGADEDDSSKSKSSVH